MAQQLRAGRVCGQGCGHRECLSAIITVFMVTKEPDSYFYFFFSLAFNSNEWILILIIIAPRRYDSAGGRCGRQVHSVSTRFLVNDFMCKDMVVQGKF